MLLRGRLLNKFLHDSRLTTHITRLNFMKFSLAQLKKMDVETELGLRLGRVFNIIFDTEGQNVLQYEVGNYFNKKLYLVSRDQVVKFEDKKMIVDDSVKKVKVGEGAEEKSQVEVGAVAMREENS